MTSLSWKKKTSGNLKRKSAPLFNEDDDSSNAPAEVEEDWRNLLPHKKSLLEDGNTKSKRMMEEGIILAQEQRYWEAISRFDEALSFKQNEAKLYEMKAQAFLELGELYPAIEAAEKAVQLSPLWAEAHQTLGRARISFGNIKLALRSFCIAIHLKPDFTEVYEEDLAWALDLLEKEKHLKSEAKTLNDVVSEENGCLKKVATVMNDDDEKYDAFTLFDKVGDDKVDSAQIILLLRSLGLNPLTSDIKKVMKDSGLDGVRIDFPTFVSIYEQFQKRPSIANHADMIEMFKTFDRDGSKHIFGGEFRQILLNLGDVMTEVEIDHFIKPRENDEGYVQYEELLKFVMNG